MDPVLHADLSQRAVVRADESSWRTGASVGPRVLSLDRLDDSRIWSTNLVQLTDGQRLQIGHRVATVDAIVLAGAVACEGPTGRALHSRYTYIRLAAGDTRQLTAALPSTLMIKQYDLTLDDPRTVVVAADPTTMCDISGDGLSILPLYRGPSPVRVSLLRFSTGTRLDLHDHPDGEEFLVLEGSLSDEWGTYGVGSWVRQPATSEHAPHSTEGCLMYSRAGHLL